MFNSHNTGPTDTRFVAALFLVLAVFLMSPDLYAQGPGAGGPDPGAAAPNDQGQTYAPLGNSSFRVLVPEIKMNQILKARPPKQKPAVPPDESTSFGEQTKEPREKREPEVPVQRDTSLTPESPRLPFDPTLRQRGRGAVPERPRLEEAPPAKETGPSLTAPVAPEDLMIATPVKKEMLGKKTAPQIPGLLEAQRSKETPKTVPLKAQETPAIEGPIERIPFETRGEPEIIPWKERTSKPSPATLPATDIDSAMAPKESTSSMPVTGPDQDKAASKESLAVVEPAIPPAKEALKSPFDEGTPDTPEIKYYLRDTAPILEELSLLMTRAPSITIGDYDPSDANAPLFPKDLQLKMDSMKRDLQILDSKTFAIIPPKRFEQFHAIIRDSITQTHQACDAIINYLAEPNEANFKMIQDHLFRARELIQKTRTSHG